LKTLTIAVENPVPLHGQPANLAEIPCETNFSVPPQFEDLLKERLLVELGDDDLLSRDMLIRRIVWRTALALSQNLFLE
jgi:hypothetical protein